MPDPKSTPLLTFRRAAVLLLVLCLSAGHAMAQLAVGQATVTAAVDRDAVKAGESVTVHVTIDVPDGLHAQSNTPSDPAYIPLTVTTPPLAGVTYGKPVYPPGQDESYPALGTLNVYTGTVVVDVPVTINADAANGPLTLAGVVRYQACNDSACFPPKRVPFSVVVTVSGGATAPAATTTPATQPAATQATAVVPTTSPSAGSASGGSPVVGSAFGFQLTDDAYLVAFAAAFVVGIFFNAVPCVLPVVPLKIVGFYEAAQHDRRRCLLLGFAFSVGLVTSFAVLAVLVVGLRTLTWGGLFQQTWFTVTIVVVLLVMAASQFGLFTFNLPMAAYGFTPRHDTLTGNAMFGVLTAALSTPCTIGPFSALLVWALRQPPAAGAALVVVVGCGMAFPYLVLSAFPQVVRRFPRTGPVGEIIKQTLAFFVLATAIYFARPLINTVVPASAFWWTLFAVVAAGMVFLVVRTIRAVGTRRAISISSVVAAVVTGGALVAVLLLARHPYDWQPYSDQALADARRDGRTVLVDFTADWCGNCQWLEAWVINDGVVANVVQTGNVVMLRADVTHGDEPGVPLKDKLVPTGEIPLTLVYHPSREDPAMLKGVYTRRDLLDALDHAPVQN